MDLDRFIPNRSMDLDRFIPNRAAMDFDFARYILGGGKKVDELTSDYQRVLADALGMNRTRILEFKSPAPVKLSRYSLPDYNPSMPKSNLKPKPPRQIPPTPVQFFTTRELVGDYGLNLLDWGSRNILAIGLVDSVYLWDATKSSAFVLGELEEEAPVTSVSWAPDGQHISVGVLDGTSKIQIWDSTSNKKLRTLRACGPYRVGSMTWNNNHILTAGTRSGQIINYDLRIKSGSCCVLGYRGHTQEICGLKWAASGRELATGGNDNLLQIWDIRRRAKCLHKLGDHTAAVRALDWCPFDRNLLASGAGEGDGCIKFWNTVTGACLNSIDTGSEVCSLLWNKNERELLSSHGLPQNQLTLWKYPSMAKISELTDHTSRVLYMAASPNGCTVASSAGDGDESMRLWNVFGVPERVKPEPFANVNRIR